jgi:cysteine-rich repeat protein
MPRAIFGALTGAVTCALVLLSAPQAIALCGNGVLDGGEACDDGNTLNGDYCSSDCATITGFCGDNIMQTNEACDDGNLTDGDGCQADCTITPVQDSVVLPRRPIRVTIPLATPSVTVKVRVKVRNADSGAGHTIRLVAADGNCPPGTVGTPDFDGVTPGPQDSVLLSGGRVKGATVPLTISSAAFTTFNRKSPARCTPTFTVNAVPLSIDPVPANDTVTVELNVTDQNDTQQTTLHESVIDSIVPVTVQIPAGIANAVVTVRPKVGNADYLVGPEAHQITATASDGDCPAGTVGVVDLDRNAPGTQPAITLAGGHTRGGLLALTITAGGFTTTSAASPTRCTALLTATGPAGNTEPDASNNTTRLVIDVIDKNDF